MSEAGMSSVGMSGATMAERLRVDPSACTGVGICTHLAPDLIGVDSWGYPMVAGDALGPVTHRQARAAVAACPRRALFVESTGYQRSAGQPV